jgi:hypothetical protein
MADGVGHDMNMLWCYDDDDIVMMTADGNDGGDDVMATCL